MGRPPKQPRFPDLPAGEQENVDDVVKAARATTKRDDRPRIYVPLAPDGRADLGSITDKHRAKLEAAGLLPSTGDPAAPSVQLPPVMVDAIAQALSGLEVALVCRLTKAPRDLVTPIASFTADERAALVPALSEVLNKYGGPLLARYGAELVLLTTWATITMAKVQAVQEVMKQAPGPRRVNISEPPEGVQ